MAFADEIVRSLHDPALYREAGGRSLMRGLLQIGRLALLAALAITVVATLRLSSLWREHVAPILDALPTIVIKDGVATVAGPQPWVRGVRDPSGREWLVILDTRAPSPEFPPDKCGVMLARTELRFKGPGPRVGVLPLSRVPDVTLGPHALRRAVLWRLMLLPPLLLLAATLWFLLAKAAQAALLAAWLGRSCPQATRRARFNVAAHALTAAVLFDCLTWWLPVPKLVSGLAYVALAVCYGVAGGRQLSGGAA